MTYYITYTSYGEYTDPETYTDAETATFRYHQLETCKAVTNLQMVER